MSVLKIKNANQNWESIPAIKGENAKINGVNTLLIEAGTNITLDQEGNTLTINSTGGGGGTSDYTDLTNKPKINNVELNGNKTSSDLGLQPAGNYLTSETDPTVPNHVKNITQANITNWNNKADSSDIPDVSNFITKTVNDLTNYYKKSETFTKQEVNNLISAITTIDIQVVQTLPVQDISTTTIYLVPKTTAETNDAYDEYIYVSNAWEHIGSTEVDLTNYVTKTDYATTTEAGVMSSTDKIKVNETSGYYGTCSTAAGTSTKVVVCDNFVLETGTIIYVKFTNAQTYNGTATLNVNSTGAKDIARVGTTKTTRYYWTAGELVGFVYDGTNYLMIEKGTATTSYYGLTKLTTSATSTSDTVALTPKSLNSFAQGVVADYPVYSTSETYQVGDRVRYSYGIYECITAIPTSEAWTAAHWQELPSLQEQITDINATIGDIDTILTRLTTGSGV